MRGVGLRSISRLLSIPKSTVSRILLKEGSKLSKPNNFEIGEEYEVDELRTFVGSKDNECWVCYAINRNTKQVIDFIVGRRTKQNLKKIIDSLLQLYPKRVYTDKLNSYPGLVPQALHSTRFRGTNYIERNNLTLRTHLKRLNKKTICYSKSAEMLSTCLALYFWKQTPPAPRHLQCSGNINYL